MTLWFFFSGASSPLINRTSRLLTCSTEEKDAGAAANIRMPMAPFCRTCQGTSFWSLAVSRVMLSCAQTVIFHESRRRSKPWVCFGTRVLTHCQSSRPTTSLLDHLKSSTLSFQS